MGDSIHYLKSRKSDYLAGVDLEIFELENKSKTLTIQNVEYKENFRANGILKQKALIIHFVEKYAKPLICNVTNSKTIKKETGIIDANKWAGFSVEFWFNTSVEMKKERVGGIRIKSVNTNGLVADLKDIDTRISDTKNRAELMAIWNDLDESQQIKYKDKVVTKSKEF